MQFELNQLKVKRIINEANKMLKDNKISEAENAINTVISHCYDLGNIYMIQGLVYECKNDYKAAIVSYSSLLLFQPTNYQVILRIAELQYYSGYFKLAEIAYLKAFNIKSNDVEILTGLANAKYSLGEFTQAIEFFNRALIVDSKNLKAKLGMAKACLELKMFEKCHQHIECYKQLSKDDKNILDLEEKLIEYIKNCFDQNVKFKESFIQSHLRPKQSYEKE